MNSQREQALIESVAYLLMLLRDAYPAQFNKAYPSEEARDRARGVWAAALRKIKPVRIRKAAEKVIRSGSKFMPSLGDIITACQFSFEELALKRPLQAYYEACNARCLELKGVWSHKAIYFAGKATGWYLLKSEPQSVAFPLFEQNYSVLCQRVMDGESLDKEIQQALENFAERDKLQKLEEQTQKSMVNLMMKQGIDPASGRHALQKVMKGL